MSAEEEGKQSKQAEQEGDHRTGISLDQPRQINHLAPDGVLANDRRRVLEDESTCVFEDGRLFHVLNTLQLRDNAGESAAAPKHGFESRWGHHLVSVDV